MCGILGGINFRVDYTLLDTIRHRGPDRQDIYDDVCDGVEISLAHTRLSIVDLSDAGNQPMVSEDGNYVLIFNGEIYNHLDLRKELKCRKYRGHSDTETLLLLLMEKGIDVLNRLNGIFSFAFYDRCEKKIILARDKFGVKPLYVSQIGDKVIFSSEIRPICKVFHISMDSDALDLLLALRYVPSPYTLFKGVSKLLPGHYCEIDMSDGTFVVQASIPYVQKVRTYQKIKFQEAVKRYAEKLNEAVERQLMGDVDMGILLSGGIDSALIARIASRKLKSPLKAFTVGFDSGYTENEIDYAAETAKCCGLEHHIVKMEAGDFFDLFSECSRIVEEPLATTSLIPMYYLARLASRYVKVVLTGQGADEPLGGYGRYQGELLHDKFPYYVFVLAQKLIKLFGVKNESLIRGSRSLGIRDDVSRFMDIQSLFTQDERSVLTGHRQNDIGRDFISYYYGLVTGDGQKSVDKMMSVDMRMNLADDLLLYTDKITMNFSLECRVPMLDVDLINFLESLPTAYKVKFLETKIIHKTYARQVLPKSIVERPKLGFQSPTDIWFKKESSYVEEKLRNGYISNILDTKAMLDILNQHKQGFNREKQLFLLLSINEWLMYHTV